MHALALISIPEAPVQLGIERVTLSKLEYLSYDDTVLVSYTLSPADYNSSLCYTAAHVVPTGMVKIKVKRLC